MSSSTPYSIATKSNTTTTGSDAVWSFAQRVNTDTTTNINNAGLTTIPIDGGMITNQSGYAINGNGIQLTGVGAYVKCTFVVHVTSVTNRTNMTLRLAKNGVLFGPVSASGYIRNASGHNESSFTATAWTKMETNDIITVEAIQEANAGTVTMATAGTSQLLLERLVNV